METGSAGPAETISLLFMVAATVADLVLLAVLWSAIVRAYVNREMLRGKMLASIAFVTAVFVPPIVILWWLYLRS